MELASFNLKPQDLLQKGNNEILKQKISEINIGEIQNVQHVKDSELAGFEKAARGFESIFMNMLYKEMKSGLDKNAFSKENKQLYSFGDKTLGGYVDMLFTEQMSNSGQGIGIANMIYKQLTGRELPYKSQTYTPLTEQVPASFNSKPESSAKPDKLALFKQATEMQTDPFSKDSFWDAMLTRMDKYQEHIRKAANENKVEENLIKSLIAAESAGKPDAVSPVGAKGLMQLMDDTAKELGVSNPFDIQQNIEGGTKYIKQMLNKFDGEIDLALAAYNAGPGNVQKYNGVPPFAETEKYITRVKDYMNKFEKRV